MPALGTCCLLLVVSHICAQDTPTRLTGVANLASPSSRTLITGPKNSSRSANLPAVINDGKFDGYAWAYLKTPVLVRFAQP